MINEFIITQTNPKTGFIDLGMGNPDLRLLPLDALRQSAEAYFASGDTRPLQYGAEQGDGYFRAALADCLSQAYRNSVNPKHLFVTSGASSALDLLCALYTHPGEVIFVEEPTYFLALRIFNDHGLKIIPISMDEHGLCLEELDELLAQYRPKFLYTIPTFQNPSGRTLTQARREELIARARRDNFFIVADEVYQLLPYSRTLPVPFAAFAQDVEQVISVNSFSKILAPGLRLGWIQAHEHIIERLAGSGFLDSGGGMNPFTSALVRELIESGGLEANIAHLRREYARRLKVMDAALRLHLPGAEYAIPQGGFFFWIHLPGVDTEKLRENAKQYKVDFRQGELFSSRRAMREYIRLSFAYYAPEEIEEGVKRLGACLRC
ncbi:MAG: PLP-dependent aminotransferase family protein [Chloroflexota bacterium]|nr:MAG: PLP-dependent aminotransferase family protein [Chloroflexota bacterium]